MPEEPTPLAKNRLGWLSVPVPLAWVFIALVAGAALLLVAQQFFVSQAQTRRLEEQDRLIVAQKEFAAAQQSFVQAMVLAESRYQEVQKILIDPVSPLYLQVNALREAPDVAAMTVPKIALEKQTDRAGQSTGPLISSTPSYPNAPRIRKLLLSYMKMDRAEHLLTKARPNGATEPMDQDAMLKALEPLRPVSTELLYTLHRMGPPGATIIEAKQNRNDAATEQAISGQSNQAPQLCLWAIPDGGEASGQIRPREHPEVARRSWKRGDPDLPTDLRHISVGEFEGLQLGQLSTDDRFGLLLPDKASLLAAKLLGAELRSARMQGVDLSHAQMQGADLSYAQIKGTVFVEAQMQGAVLQGAEMQDAVLREAQMQGADLSTARLQAADLHYARMEGASLDQTQMQGADLAHAQMQGVDLRNAQMQDANLLLAQMAGADLSSAGIQGAYLSVARGGAARMKAKRKMVGEKEVVILDEEEGTEIVLPGVLMQKVDLGSWETLKLVLAGDNSTDGKALLGKASEHTKTGKKLAKGLEELLTRWEALDPYTLTHYPFPVEYEDELKAILGPERVKRVAKKTSVAGMRLSSEDGPAYMDVATRDQFRALAKEEFAAAWAEYEAQNTSEMTEAAGTAEEASRTLSDLEKVITDPAKLEERRGWNLLEAVKEAEAKAAKAKSKAAKAK